MTDPLRHRVSGGLRSARGYWSGIRWRKLLELGPFHWRDLAPWRAVRVTVGVVVPLVAGAAGGHLDYGAFASLGALPAGFTSFQGVTRSRVTAVALASVGMAVSTFVGGTTAAAAPWMLVPVVIVWGYIVGLAVCLGPRLSVAAIQWSVALLIAVAIPLGPRDAALRAGLVLAGGLFQGILVALSWAFRRGDRERAALAESYRLLAAYASRLAAGHFGPPPARPFPAAAALADPNPLLSAAVRLNHLGLLEQAERVRTSLAALAESAADGLSEAVSDFAAAARALDLVADTLSSGHADRVERAGELRQYVTELGAHSGTRTHWAAEALFGQLRAVTGELARLDSPAGRGPEGDGKRRTVVPTAQDDIGWTALTLRANLTPAGETGRHAVRLAVVAGLAEVLVQTTGLFEGRWVVLTIFLVLKPDYTSTVYRSTQRVIGTLAGAGLGAAAAWPAHSAPGWLITAAALTVAAAYALFAVNYLLYSCFLTAYIVILLDILGFPAETTAMARLVDTAIGGAIALVAYSVWPTWEGLTAQEKFARLVEANGTYATALLRQLAHPGAFGPAQLRALQAAARRARTDAEASTARLAEEPPHPPLTPAAAVTFIAAVARLAHCELSLHAVVPPHGSAAGKGGATARTDAGRLDTMASAFGTTMNSLAEALRTLEPLGPLPPLGRLRTEPRHPSTLDPRLPLIMDNLADAADTLTDVVRRTLAPP
ncbi:FUSC family protein [Streptomyces sp. NPDC055025]